jgi:hypothetical protein
MRSLLHRSRLFLNQSVIMVFSKFESHQLKRLCRIAFCVRGTMYYVCCWDRCERCQYYLNQVDKGYQDSVDATYAQLKQNFLRSH